MFWDFRVSVPGNAGSFATRAGDELPEGLESVLAAQAMFPVTGRGEMRGFLGDPGNEVALRGDGDLAGTWGDLTARLRAIPGYRRLSRHPARAAGLPARGERDRRVRGGGVHAA